MNSHQKEFIDLLSSLAHRFRPYEIFRDFCEIGALSYSNLADLSKKEEREKRYLEIIKRYQKSEIDVFANMLGIMMNAFTEAFDSGFYDFLGEVFMSLDLGSHWKGQFFTPYPLCLMVAKMVSGDAQEIIENNRFISLSEPAIGSGAMVIAAAHNLKNEGINFQKFLHVVAVDVDITAVHMAYLHFSLMHIPAIVIHGNTITGETFSKWFTPAHILHGWGSKLKQSVAEITEAKINEVQDPFEKVFDETRKQSDEPEKFLPNAAREQLGLFD